MVMGTMAAITDLMAYFTGMGPFGDTYYQKSITIGGFEAHCLAIILGVILFTKSKSDGHFFNKIAATIHIVLGISNLIWFNVFFETGSVGMGYATTIAHFLLASFNLLAIYKNSRPAFALPRRELI